MSGEKTATTTGACCSGTSCHRRLHGHMLVSLCLWSAILMMTMTKTVCQAEAASSSSGSSGSSRRLDNGHHGNDSKATDISRIMNTRRRSTTTTTTTTATSNQTTSSIIDTAAGGNETEVVSQDTIVVLSLLSMVNTVVFVLPNTLRYAVRKRQCLSSNGNGNGCICTESQLRLAIGRTKSMKSDDIDVLVLCPAIQVTLSQTIDVTNASFRIVCAISRFINTDPCVIDDSESSNGSNNGRLFSGSPRNAAFQDVVIRGSNSGAVYATGGNWTFHDVTFVNNRAAESDSSSSSAVGSATAAVGAGMGGAIYVAAPSTTSTSIPPAYVTLFGETTFQNNVASSMGNDVYIATSTAATQSANAYVHCEASSLLNKPTFCNGNNGLVVRSPNASSIEKAIYTNCFTVADFAC